MRSFAVVLLAGISTAAGFLLGESGIPLWNVIIIAAALVLLVISGAVAPKSWLWRIGAGVTTLSGYIFALYIGQQAFLRAFNECMEQGEGVRSDLHRYYSVMNKYPENLNQLNPRVPCALTFKRSILKYTKTDGGYSLSYSDWLVEYSATEQEPFLGHK